MKILIIDGSVRNARATPLVVKWVEKHTKANLPDVEVEVADLKTLQLPPFDEAVSPMMNPERKPEGSVKQWLDALASADAYIFVTPEYNHGMSGALKDAIDYIDFQIIKKPFIVVGHGGVGGARAIEQVKLVLNANIGAIPVPNSVTVPGFVGYQNLIDENGDANTDEVKKQEGPLKDALETLTWYAQALKTAREQ